MVHIRKSSFMECRVILVRIFFRRYEKFDQDIFLEYLKDAHHKFGKIFIVLDKASEHTAKKISIYLKKCRGKIIL